MPFLACLTALSDKLDVPLVDALIFMNDIQKPIQVLQNFAQNHPLSSYVLRALPA